VKQDERLTLRDAATRAMNGAHAHAADRHATLPVEWQLQTSNSFRRIGTTYGDGDVLCGTKHPIDGHPDLLAASGVLDYIIAAQPSVVLSLLDDIDALTSKLNAVIRALGTADIQLGDSTPDAAAKAQTLIEQILAALMEARR
jgi:hypothetical protein